MDVSRALEQIAEIHGQIAKGEVYRGYRARWVGASGMSGLAAAYFQPSGTTANPTSFVTYWSAVAVGSLVVGAGELAYDYVVRQSAADRRQTRRVVGQFFPSVAAGAALAFCFADSRELVTLLPGLWAICFGIGIFASRPYLPRASGWVGLFYYTAGFTLLWIARGSAAPSGWWVGGTFGIGQLLAALVLWWNLERDTDDPHDSYEG